MVLIQTFPTFILLVGNDETETTINNKMGVSNDNGNTISANINEEMVSQNDQWPY